MRHVILAFCFVIIAFSSSAQVDNCENLAQLAKAEYRKGNYEMAKYWYEKSRPVCKDHSASFYEARIKECQDKIDKKNEYTRRRIKAEKEAIAHKEAEAIERNKKREQFRYVRITASSPVQGLFENIEYDIQNKIKTSAPGLNFTNDTSMAYWDVRVMVNIHKHAIPSPDIQKFSVEAFVEVEEALTGKVEGFTEWEEGACVSDVTEEQAAELVADEIYKRNELFCRIADSISNIINQTHVSTCPKSNSDPSKDGKRTVLLIHNKANVSNDFVDYLYDCMENFLVNDSLNRFQISSRSEEIDLLRKKELLRQEAYYRTDKISQVVVGTGVKYLCGIVISGSGNDLSFKCTVIELESGDMLKGMYALHRETFDNFSDASAENVANSLANQLGLLSEKQKAKIDNAKTDFINKKKEANKAYVLSSFVPGLTQLQSGKRLKGTLFIVGETLCIGGAIAMHSIGTSYDGKFSRTNDAEYKKLYIHNANVCYTTRNVMIGTAVAVYIWNIIDAYANKPKSTTYSLSPYVGNDNFGLAINFNF